MQFPRFTAAMRRSTTLIILLGGCTSNPPFFCENPMDIGQTITCIAWRAGASSAVKSQARHREEIARMAEEGNADAQFQLATNLFESDQATSWKWYCEAAMNGHSSARVATGLYYEYGLEPVEPDSVTALMWYRLADEEGQEWAEKLEKEIDQMKIEKADRLARDWIPGICKK